jgi:hypothetical protein
VGEGSITTGEGRKKYHIKIIRRDFGGQAKNDYHATVTRLKDGVELVWMADWQWLLKLRLRRGALNRAFTHYDKSKAKLSEVEEFCV